MPFEGGEMGNFRQITPFIHVPDIELAIAFFRDLLGFETHVRMDDYAYLHRETVGIRILKNHGSDGAPRGNRRFAYYVDVEDVDSLYSELKARLDALPAGEVHGPADKPYGQRELAIVAPDGNLIVFGHSIAEA
jgi:catechol 2,3-dioxygenase-like lactoylglutathione lyase family enzyme